MIKIIFCLTLLTFNIFNCDADEVTVLELPVFSKTIDLSKRLEWAKADLTSPKPNGILVENELLGVCAKPGEKEVLIYGKTIPDASIEIAKYVFLDLEERELEIKSTKLSKLKNGVQIEIKLSNESLLLLFCESNLSNIKINFDSKIGSFRVKSKMVVIFRPDFFDTNIIFHPSLSLFAQDSSFVPIQNYLFGMLSENAVVGCTWNSKKVRVKISSIGKTQDKYIDSIQFYLDPADPEFFSGVINIPKGFISTSFEGLDFDKLDPNKKKEEYLNISTTWKAPFLARWTSVILHGFQDSTIPSSVPVTRMWRLRAPKIIKGHEREADEVNEFLWEKSDPRESDKRLWKPRVMRGAIYNGKDTLNWSLEKRFIPYTIGIVFPMAREIDTPPNIVTLVDFIRESLGEKSLTDVLDVPGLKDRRIVDGHPTPQASCGAMDIIVDMIKKIDLNPEDPKIEEAKEEVRSRIIGIQWYFQLLADRAQEFLENTNMLEKYANEHLGNSPGCKMLSEAILASCAEIKKEWRIENGKEDTLTRKWQDLFWIKTYDSFKVWNAKMYSPINQCANTQVSRGDSIDSFVSKASKGFRRIISASYLLGGKDNESLIMANEVIGISHAAIRCRHWMEDKVYIERCLNNPVRLAPTSNGKK